MRERMQKYLANIDRLLKTAPEGTDWEAEIQKHLIQMGFFMHERLIHLIVTVLVAILTVAAILFAVTSPSIGMLILIVALMCLLIPYILHYYLLENGVQAMYRQYDEMLARKEGKNPACTYFTLLVFYCITCLRFMRSYRIGFDIYRCKSKH